MVAFLPPLYSMVFNSSTPAIPGTGFPAGPGTAIKFLAITLSKVRVLLEIQSDPVSNISIKCYYTFLFSYDFMRNFLNYIIAIDFANCKKSGGLGTSMKVLVENDYR